MTEETTWPELPEVDANDPKAEVKLALYNAKLEVIKAERQAAIDNKKAEHQAAIDNKKAEHQAAIDSEIERTKAIVGRIAANYANEYATFQEVYKGYIEVAKSEIDRSIQRAEFVQKVAAAIGTAYAAILALSFSVAHAAPLPVTGLAPTLFFGLAFFLAAAYVAYLTPSRRIRAEPSDGTLRGSQISRRNSFITWTRFTVLRRRYLLQASVVSLAIGLFFLPAPYIGQFDAVLWWLVLIGIALTFLIPAVIERISSLQSDT